jgi:hypothetical protein
MRAAGVRVRGVEECPGLTERHEAKEDQDAIGGDVRPVAPGKRGRKRKGSGVEAAVQPHVE